MRTGAELSRNRKAGERGEQGKEDAPYTINNNGSTELYSHFV